MTTDTSKNIAFEEIVDEQLLPIHMAEYAYRQTYSISKGKFRSPAKFDFETAKWPKDHGIWSDLYLKRYRHKVVLHEIMRNLACEKDDSNLMPKYIFRGYVVNKPGYERYYLIVIKNPQIEERSKQSRLNDMHTMIQTLLGRGLGDIVQGAAILQKYMESK